MDLHGLLSNTLILQHTAPYIPITGLLNLAATNKDFQNLIFNTPSVFRYLNLSTVKTRSHCSHNSWKAGQLSTWYGAFHSLARRGVLPEVRILVLDDLYLTADLLHAILCCRQLDCPMQRVCKKVDSGLCPDCYPQGAECPVPENVRILSILECEGFDREGFLANLVNHITRSNRPKGTPRVQGLYCFGAIKSVVHGYYPEDICSTSVAGVTTSIGSQLGMQAGSAPLVSSTTYIDPWYEPGRISYGSDFDREDWGLILQQCRGVMFFDAVTCQQDVEITNSGARDGHSGRCLSMAELCLASRACQDCKSLPEGGVRYTGEPSADLPLLAPPPLHSASIAAAQRLSHGEIDTKELTLYARCDNCIRGWNCDGCMAFWCERCYPRYEYKNGRRFVTDRTKVKVHLGLCIEKCLVEEMYNSGSDGMWG